MICDASGELERTLGTTALCFFSFLFGLPYTHTGLVRKRASLTRAECLSSVLSDNEISLMCIGDLLTW